MKIGLASDHAGYELKEIIKIYLKEKGNEVIDFGTFSPDSCDYADYGHELAKSVENKDCNLGFSFCGSGNGINMTVNKHQGIRAALCWNKEIAELARKHNDANICSLPARFITNQQAYEIVHIFLATTFENGRHQIRINKIPFK